MPYYDKWAIKTLKVCCNTKVKNSEILFLSRDGVIDLFSDLNFLKQYFPYASRISGAIQVIENPFTLQKSVAGMNSKESSAVVNLG